MSVIALNIENLDQLGSIIFVIMVCDIPLVGQHLLQSDSLKPTLLRGFFVKARAGALTAINPSTLSCGDHQTVIASN